MLGLCAAGGFRLLIRVVRSPPLCYASSRGLAAAALRQDRAAASTAAWRIGDPPEGSVVNPAVTHVADARDLRLAIYRQRRTLREHTEADSRIASLRARAQSLAGREGRCLVDLHYGWDCLRRLRSAQEAGRLVLVDSVLISALAPDEVVDLAATVVDSPGSVYAVEPGVFKSEFQSKAVGQIEGACTFVVAFPVSTPLTEMRPPFVILDDVMSPRNIGQILRAALHLGVTSIVASKGAWENLTGRAARSSMGWLYHLDFHYAHRLPDALRELQSLDIRLYAAEEGFDVPVAPHEPHGDRKWALVVGNEASGVSKEARKISDVRIKVPQRGGASMNVGHAASICLYELGRHMDS